MEKGIIVVNIVGPENTPARKHRSKSCDNKNNETAIVALRHALFLHLVHLDVKISLLVQSSAFSDFLLLTLALDFLCDKVLVRLQAALDMDLELDDVVEHALELCV